MASRLLASKDIQRFVVVDICHTLSFAYCPVAEVQGSFRSSLYIDRNAHVRYRVLSKLTKKKNFRTSNSK